MSWNKSQQYNPYGPSSMEKGKLPQRYPSISSSNSSIDLPPKAYAKHPKATPPPYYTSAKKLPADPFPELSGSKTKRPPSFCRRHWFIITVVLVVIATCAFAIVGVMLQKRKPSQTPFLPVPDSESAAQGGNFDTFFSTSFTNPLEQDARTTTG